MNRDKQDALDQLAVIIGKLVGNRRQELLGDLQSELDAPRTTLESRLSNLENAKRAGAKYFFHQDPRRGEALLRLLGASDDQLAEIRALVGAVFAAPPGTQLVVDVSDWSFDGPSRPRLWKIVERVIRTGPSPAVLVLTVAQHADLPRLFDDLVSLAKVEKAEDGPEAVRTHAGEEALVVAMRRFDPWTRWVAIDPSSSSASTQTEPALERAATLGATPRTPLAYVDELGVEPATTPPETPRAPTALRRLLTELEHGLDEDASAASSHVPADTSERLALANALGVRAAATRQECRDFARASLVDVLGAAPPCGSRGDLDALLERAGRRAIEDAALLVDDELHLVNHTAAEITGSQFLRVIPHEVSCAEPALARLRAAIESFTEAEWLDDPYLSATLERLVEEGANHRELLHARATLFHSGLAEPRPLTRRTDAGWREALLRLLESPPLPTALRASMELVHGTGSPRNRYFIGLEDASASTLDVALEVPPMGDRILTRDGPEPVIVARAPLEHVESEHWAHLPDIILSVDPTAAGNAGSWCDLVEASKGLLLPDGSESRRVSLESWSEGLRGLPVGQKAISRLRKTSAASLPGSTWATADRLLAVSCWTLREALTSARPHPLHDGTWLIEIGGTGFFAEIDVYELDPARETAPPLLDAVLYTQVSTHGSGLEVNSSYWRWDHLVPVLAASQYQVRVGGWLPHGLTFRGEGLYARVRYGASPLLAGRTTARAAAVSAIASAVAQEEEDEQRRRDDDDDD